MDLPGLGGLALVARRLTRGPHPYQRRQGRQASDRVAHTAHEKRFDVECLHVLAHRIISR